jgi:ankyrin repeat protein
MVKLLIEAGANINIQDESGNTPLHYSAANGKKDVVKYLLDNKADASIVNVKEQKAIDYSNVKGFNEITELILKYAPSGTVVTPIQKEETPKTDISNSMEVKKKALLDLKELLDAGILTSEEFDIEKSKILKG